jgi:hypothetical protein
LKPSNKKGWHKPHAEWYLTSALLIGLAVLIVSISALLWVPPVSKDALVHHLAVPKLYLKHGGMHEIPNMEFSYYPMNLDLMYLIPLYFGNDIIPKLIHFAFAKYAMLGVIFFLSIPIIVKLSITAYVDLGLIFFSTASLLFLLKWAESRLRPRFLILSATFCGLAMGTKYNGLITCLLLTSFVLFLYPKYARDVKFSGLKCAGYGSLFLLVALIFFSPWMVRNYIWTNNPIFPLYDHWFNARQGIDQERLGFFSVRAVLYGEGWWEMALLPIRIFFQGQDGSPQYFDGKLNPFLLFLPFFAFYRIRRDPQTQRKEKKIFLSFAVLFFSFAFFSSGLRIRYVSPMIPPLVILSVFGVKKLSETIKGFRSETHQKIGELGILFMIFFFLWPNARYIFDQYRNVKPFDYLTGEITRDEYIERYRPEHAAMKYINDTLPIDSRILFIFLGRRGYYCDREYVFDMNGTKSMLRQLVKKADKPEEVLQALEERGISHMLINDKIFKKWSRINFDIKENIILNTLIEKYTKILYIGKGYKLLELNRKLTYTNRLNTIDSLER